MNTTLPQSIEAILFATAESHTYAFLAEVLGVTIADIAGAVETLASSLEGHGITIVTLNEVVSLATTGDHTALIERIRKDELSKELSKASAETLAIIAYMPGVTKSQIEFIRGVNVTYSVRALLMRGLVEQRGSGRSVGYHPTIALLEHFGVTALEELPEYAATKATVESLLTTTPQS